MKIMTKQRGGMTYLTADSIPVPHCFTTRLGGVSTGHLSSLNIGIHRGDSPENVARNYEFLGALLGFQPENLVAARQIHSDIVCKVGKADCGKHLAEGGSPVCDALITNQPGVALVVFTADCTPILFHDPVTGAVGAAHAGWRGTAAGIAAKTVEAMVSAYGCKPENIHAAIGPHIGRCCFETDRDVPDAMLAALGREAQAFIRPRGDKFDVDLTGINTAFLRRAGVESIASSDACTACRTDLFWSHRRMGNLRGSQGAIIVCKEGI